MRLFLVTRARRCKGSRGCARNYARMDSMHARAHAWGPCPRQLVGLRSPQHSAAQEREGERDAPRSEGRDGDETDVRPARGVGHVVQEEVGVDQRRGRCFSLCGRGFRECRHGCGDGCEYVLAARSPLRSLRDRKSKKQDGLPYKSGRCFFVQAGRFEPRLQLSACCRTHRFLQGRDTHTCSLSSAQDDRHTCSTA